MRLTALSCFLVSLLTACVLEPETSLGGDYFLVDNDPDHRWIDKRTDQGRRIVIDQQITGFRKRGDFVVVRRKVAISYECQDEFGEKTIITHRTDSEQYWILDINKEEEIGPLNASEIVTVASNLNFEGVDVPEQISYRSNDSWFESRISHCAHLEQISWGE